MHGIALCVLHVVRPRTSLALILRSKILQHSSLKTIWGRSIAERGPKLLGRSACATIEKTPARRQRATTTNAKALDISAVSRHSGVPSAPVVSFCREGAGLVPCFLPQRCASTPAQPSHTLPATALPSLFRSASTSRGHGARAAAPGGERGHESQDAEPLQVPP